MRERTTLAEQVRAITTDIQTLERAKCILNGQRTGTHFAKSMVVGGRAQPFLARGAFTKAVLEVLRDAKQPLTVMEVGQAALSRLRLPENAMTKSALNTKVITSTTSHVRKGTLRRVERQGEPLRLEVAR